MTREGRTKQGGPWRSRRGVITAALSALLIGVVGVFWPRTNSGVPGPQFELIKLDWKHEADLVIGGDSRAAGGLSPGAMKDVLGERRILNFAFSNNGYAREYLEAIDRVLDPNARRKAIVIGVSPFALTKKLEGSGYLAAQRPQWFRLRWKHFGDVLGFFEPIEPWQVIDRLRGHPERGFFREYHPDGWLASRLVPPKLTVTVVKAEREYLGDRVSPEVSARLIASVREWRGRGIEVYGFRTPAAPEVVRAEEVISGFDPVAFSTAWREAGGVWIDLPAREWSTYDGSHLVPEEAVVLSGIIARAIAEAEQSR